MKKLIFSFLTLVIVSCSSGGDNPDPTPIPTEDNFVRAADMSFVPEIEGAGVSFKYNNTRSFTYFKKCWCKLY